MQLWVKYGLDFTRNSIVGAHLLQAQALIARSIAQKGVSESLLPAPSTSVQS